MTQSLSSGMTLFSDDSLGDNSKMVNSDKDDIVEIVKVGVEAFGGSDDGGAPLDISGLVASWSSLAAGQLFPVRLSARVVGVTAHLADYSTYSSWREGRGLEWRKGMMLPSYLIR